MSAITVAAVLASIGLSDVAQAATATFLPAADSYVRSDKASSNFGLATGLQVDGSPTTNAYLRFDLGALTGKVTGATLKVFTRSSSGTGITLSSVSGNLWGETTVTYANAPPIEAQVGKSGSFSSGAWVSLDAKPLVPGSGAVSMALKTTSSSVKNIDSRESINKPQLVITTVAPPSNGAAPTISGTSEAGQVLTADPGTWSGDAPIAYAYQWRRCDAAGASCADIAGATAKSYAPAAGDVGSTVRVAVTASNTAGSAVAASGATAVVGAAAAATAPFNGSPPTISGSAEVGQTLAADPGTWSGSEPIAFAYQWRRCDATGASCADITGATGKTYLLGAGDVPSTILVAVTASNQAGSSTVTSAGSAVVSTSADPVIAAAGDIACDSASTSFNGGLGSSTSCRQKYTSDLLIDAGLARVLALGDAQYESGVLATFGQSYDPSWGRVKGITSPAVGNHEYQTAGAAGYFDYFNGAGNSSGPAGDRTGGYYSFNIGAWHLVALNSNCSRVGCGAGSAQEQWLRQDLAASTATCTLAYWHHPLFSSGTYAPGVSSVKPLFQALYDYRADVLLTGHDHNYERFSRQDPNGVLDTARGVREFIVGTGGKNHSLQGAPIANSEVRDSDSFGVLRLTLHPTGYEWRFAAEAGKTFTDSGGDSCDSAASDTVVPTAPTNLTATATGSNRVDLNWGAASDDMGVTKYEVYRDGALLSTTATPVTTYTDTTVAPSTVYEYQVNARDAAGNVSVGSNKVAVTTPYAVALAFSAEADARAHESSPTANYGTSYLRTDGGSDPDVESYLRFTVSGVSGSVQSAKLRLYAYTNTADGPAIYSTSSAWSETGINWGNRPGRVGGATDDKGAIPTNAWVEYNVTPLVTGNGTYSFVLAATSSDGVDLYSREAASLRPELVLTVG